MAAFLIVGLGGASIVGPTFDLPVRRIVIDPLASQTLKDLIRVGLLPKTSQASLDELLTYQSSSGKSLAAILREPIWLERLSLTANTFKATWYASNPFELLPTDLQFAIRKSKNPFESRSQIKRWLQNSKAPQRWVDAMNKALIETTPENLWRASRGKRPYAKNGQYLQPIVVEKSDGQFETFDGHIATDPNIIPTNSRVLILVRINGKERILKVKATDIGQAIKGRHVDLPISLRPRPSKNHAFLFPGKYIRNPTIVILSPAKKVSRDRKA